MKKIIILLLFCSLIVTSIKTKASEVHEQEKTIESNYEEILGTKWIAPIISISRGIVYDSLIFNSDCTSVFYACGFGEKSFGKFYLKSDTVKVKSNITHYPDNIIYKHTFKLLLFNDTLKPVYAKFGHLDPKTEFDSTFVFYKIDTNKTNKLPTERYHILELTASDPRIAERCVELSKIQELNCRYVKETLDSLSRCIKLEFYETKGVFLRYLIYLPSIVEYMWTDSSLIEKLYSDDGKLLTADGGMVRPNKIEYLLSDFNITKIKNSFNEELINIETCKDCSIDNTVFFLMYSGCNEKFSEKYKMRF
jgi:hypothetical protein